MAEEIAIRGSTYLGKERAVVAPILLPFITLGIYAIVWHYKINKELAAIGEARGREDLGDNPMLSLLALFPGVLLLGIPTIVSYWNTWKRQDAARKLFGVDEGIDNVPGFLLHLFVSPVGVYFFQRGQNAVLEAQARG